MANFGLLQIFNQNSNSVIIKTSANSVNDLAQVMPLFLKQFINEAKCLPPGLLDLGYCSLLELVIEDIHIVDNFPLLRIIFENLAGLFC